VLGGLTVPADYAITSSRSVPLSCPRNLNTAAATHLGVKLGPGVFLFRFDDGERPQHLCIHADPDGAGGPLATAEVFAHVLVQGGSELDANEPETPDAE